MCQHAEGCHATGAIGFISFLREVYTQTEVRCQSSV
jgi:hypothetical protein